MLRLIRLFIGLRIHSCSARLDLALDLTKHWTPSRGVPKKKGRRSAPDCDGVRPSGRRKLAVATTGEPEDAEQGRTEKQDAARQWDDADVPSAINKRRNNPVRLRL